MKKIKAPVLLAQLSFQCWRIRLVCEEDKEQNPFFTRLMSHNYGETFRSFKKQQNNFPWNLLIISIFTEKNLACVI